MFKIQSYNVQKGKREIEGEKEMKQSNIILKKVTANFPQNLYKKFYNNSVFSSVSDPDLF